MLKDNSTLKCEWFIKEGWLTLSVKVKRSKTKYILANLRTEIKMTNIDDRNEKTSDTVVHSNPH